jgi:protein involved in polysaccharide export with SLBB domain
MILPLAAIVMVGLRAEPLKPGDLVYIGCYEVPEHGRPIEIAKNGTIQGPIPGSREFRFVGALHIAGLSAVQAESKFLKYVEDTWGKNIPVYFIAMRRAPRNKG